MSLYPSRRQAVVIAGAVAMLAVLSACVATQPATVMNADSPGFIQGLWHGFILPVSFVVSLFTEQVSVYAVPNNGPLYNLGFVLGVIVLGIGARSSKRR
jgi:hypothetical protein